MTSRPALSDVNESSDDDFYIESPKHAVVKKPAAKKPSQAAGKKKNAAVTGAAAAMKDEDGMAKDKENPMDVFESIDKATDGGKKRLSIEHIYQKKTQLEHILLRPDTYIGSVEFTEKTPMWVYDEETKKIVNKEIRYVPGLYKIFDEILVNAADNKQRDPSMNTIKVDINREKNEISVWNNGKGIPIAEHKVEKVYVPELIFGTLLTSSNYNDSDKKVTGGRNGYGAKLCNIFSKKFTVETSSKDDKKLFKQTWTNNMQNSGTAKIDASKGDDYTKVTFVPDLEKFKMDDGLDDDIVGLLSRRALDVAGTLRGVRVFLNGQRLPIQGFKQYVEEYVSGHVDGNGDPLKIVYENVNDRWEVAVALSDEGFRNVSFVNSIATTKGGRHVDYVTDQITKSLVESVNKKVGSKSGVSVKPFQIKTHLWIFVNALIENPTFDSQTKETMTLQSKSFGSKCELSEKFITQTMKCGIVDAVMSWVKMKQQETLDKKCSGKKTTKLKGIQKLEDANDAGTKNSMQCTLILTEGDSAKALAVSGLGVVGRDKYGVFPLRGKLLNVRDAGHKQIMENVETNALIKILNLQYKRKYDTEEDMKSLRYGKVMVMADQDQDGSHIKGLVINFIHHNWPTLIQKNFVEEFITPIVKATKGKDEISFFSIPEYMEWKQATANWNTYHIKYYKGLGTSTSKEAREYFSDMVRHRIKFKHTGKIDDDSLEMAFSKSKVEQRKEWLTKFMDDRKRRREEHQPDIYLYNKDTKVVTFADFVNKELVLFSNTDNERSIPSLVDGLKPGQRKVLFTCLKRADKREVKVAQLAGSVGEKSAYHHGEASLMSTIVGLAQDFVGSNNINLLLPIGQFGTRLQGGKDSASPRYIFTMLNPVTRALFPVDDDNVLRFLFEENQRIEPEWYCPIIPMVLVNGAEGIGTGWSTKIPNYNPREIVENVRRMINNEPLQPMAPWFKNFRGTIEKLDNTRYACSGEISIVDDETIEITELPIRVWTSAYKESVLDVMLGTEKLPPTITDYKEYNTDATVKFIVKMTAEKMATFQREGLHSVFKLQSSINLTSMVLFDADGCLRKFDRIEDIFDDFFKARRQKYIERKRFLEGMLQAQALRLSNQARFILEKIKGVIVIENKKKAFIVQKLIELKFDPDPVKKWKDSQRKLELDNNGEASMDEDGGDDGDEAAEIASVTNKELDTKLSDYDYLVGMAMIKLSEEEKDKMLKESDAKKLEYDLLLSKTWADLWKTDLDNFLVELDKQEEKERRDRESSLKQQIAKKTTELAGGRGKKKLIATLDEVRPSPKGARVQPKIEAMIKKYDKIDQAKAKEKTGGGRVRKPKKEAKNNSDEHDDADTPLHERVMKRRSDEADGNKNQPKLTKFLTKVEVGGGATKSKKKTDSVAAAAPKAKKPKRAAQFDSDEDEEEAASDSEKATSVGDWKKSITSDDGDSNLATPIESKKPSLRQKPKKTYVFDSDDDDNDNGKVDDDSEIVLSDDDDVSDDDF